MTELIVRETVGERIQVLPRPIVLPGKCAVCGHTGTNNTGDGTPVLFIDIGLDIDYYGRVYFCTTCAIQVMDTIGFITPTAAEALRQQIQSQESELITLRTQNAQLRSALGSLLGQPDPSVLGDLSFLEQSSGSGREETPDGNSSLTNDEPSPSESASSEGSDGISGNSSNESELGFDL